MDIIYLLLYTIPANVYASHPLVFGHYFIILLHVQELCQQNIQVLKIQVFWVVTPYGLVNSYQQIKGL